MRSDGDLAAQKAAEFKEKGNAAFKAAKFQEAVDCYSEAYELAPLQAVLPCNRAMALLKMQRFAEAKDDCDSAIRLDGAYAKAYFRRALALAAMHRLGDARSDLERVLQLEPNNGEARKRLNEIKAELQQKSSTTVSSESVRSDLGAHSELVARLPPGEVFLSGDLRRVEVKEANACAECARQSSVTADVRNLPSSVTPVLQFDVPSTSLQFMTDWTHLRRKNGSMLASYFWAIRPTLYGQLFGESLTSDVLSDVVRILAERSYSERDDVLRLRDTFANLAKVKRIRTLLMFLDASDRSRLTQLMSKLRKACEHDSLRDQSDDVEQLERLFLS